MFRNPIRLAFSGKQRAGKDTSAEYVNQLLFNHTEANIHVLKFADPLHEVVTNLCKMTGIPDGKHRHLKQYIGTDWARAKNENAWVNAFHYTNNHLLYESVVVAPDTPVIINPTAGVHACITDARFPNEATYCTEHGFKLIRVQALDRVRAGRGANLSAEQHASETALDDWGSWDYVIHNNGSLQELHLQLDKIMLELYPWIYESNG